MQKHVFVITTAARAAGAIHGIFFAGVMVYFLWQMVKDDRRSRKENGRGINSQRFPPHQK